ncbi:hypothetical protein EYF80_036422 [Liparis tanakae]|uniref:Uncharacterized protein n=1 Tax=Liparis tanakae TaxID=230148 RepID=A0A4Z2GJC7_9TELE|nr:hypothetical protein EYF80_036422 [Liparis tanakae]
MAMTLDFCSQTICQKSPRVVDSYIELLQRDLLLQKAPHHADHSVELQARVLAIGDHLDEGQGGESSGKDEPSQSVSSDSSALCCVSPSCPSGSSS